MCIRKRIIAASEFQKQTADVFNMLAGTNKKEYFIKEDLSQEQIHIDMAIYLEILENIAANACGISSRRISFRLMWKIATT